MSSGRMYNSVWTLNLEENHQLATKRNGVVVLGYRDHKIRKATENEIQENIFLLVPFPQSLNFYELENNSPFKNHQFYSFVRPLDDVHLFMFLLIN